MKTTMKTTTTTKHASTTYGVRLEGANPGVMHHRYSALGDILAHGHLAEALYALVRQMHSEHALSFRTFHGVLLFLVVVVFGTNKGNRK